MEDYKDFYVTLMSNKHREYFARNSSSDFINYFDAPLHIPSNIYQVGLAQIDFDYPKNEKKPAEVIVAEYPENERDLIINKRVISYIYLDNKGKNARDFFNQCTLKLKELKAPFAFFINNPNRVTGERRIKLTLENLGGRTLTLPTELATVLGFDELEFAPGVHIATREWNSTFYDTLDKKQRFELRVSHWAETKIKLEVPVAWNPDDVLATVMLGLQKTKENIGVYEDAGSIVVILDGNSLNLRFPPAINEFFKLERNHVFTKATQQIPIVPSINKSERINPRGAIHVYADIIENQRIGSCSLPIIRSIFTATNTDESHNFDSVFYMHPSSQQVQQIRVKLLDGDFELIPKSDKPSSVVLHFKRIS